MRLGLVLAGICLLLSGCVTPGAIPTVANIDAAGTAQILTLNAPPPGFRDIVQFPKVDDNLASLPSWHYTVTLTFDGVFSGTTDKAVGSITAEVFSNELVGERRVLLKASGAAFGLKADRNVEGVRISNDYYLVDQNKVCSKVTNDQTSRNVAELTAGSLIGGVNRARPTGERKTVTQGNVKVDAWQYSFLPGDVNPPAIDLSDGGKMTVASGDFWVVPASKAVLEYSITFNVENSLLQGDRQLTGQVRAAYTLVETGAQYNISIPYGC